MKSLFADYWSIYKVKDYHGEITAGVGVRVGNNESRLAYVILRLKPRKLFSG